MTKRVLNRIRLDKIAAVDLPCQEHATVAIIKRAPGPQAPPAIVKKTFQEALNNQLISEKISDTFWRAFENQWAVREAFRVAMTDEIAAGGDGTEAIAGFTEAMQTIATTAATLARDAASTADTNLETAVEEAVTKWLQQREHPMPLIITTKAQLTKAVADFNPETSPAAHVGIIQKAARDLDATDELPASGILALGEGNENAVLKRRVAVLEMAPAIRKHFDALPADAQTSFLAKSAADRQAEVDAANTEDPVVYTTTEGDEIRKSHGALAVTMAKRMDAQAATIAKLSGTVTENSLEKRAAKYANVAKSEAMDLLKSADAVGVDSDTGKSILKTLDRMNKSRDGIFKSLGSTEAPEIGGDIQKAKADFKSKVSEIAKRDGKGQAEAMSKARVEHADLFAEAYPESVRSDDEEEDA